MIYANIQQIDVYQYEYLGIDSNGNDIHNSRFVGSYLNHTFSFSKTTGVLTLGDSVYSYLISNAQAKASAYIGDPDYEVFYVFEIKVAKYQALDPTNSDENRVATMQAIEQNILEYTYQYRHAQITQETLSQMCYTVFVTTISTILTVGATFGIGKLAKYLTKGAGVTTIPTFTESLLGDVSKWATRPTIGTMIVGMAAKTTLVSFVLSPIFESMQEIFMDPLLEIVVSELVASLGLDIFMQVFINSLVEGGRESITGPMSQFLFGDTQTSTQNLVSERHITNEISAEKAALETISERESHIKIKPQWSSILKTGATLVLGAALVGIGGPMFFSGTLVAGFSAIKTFSKSFKIHKTIIHNIVVQSSSSESAKIISDLDMVGVSDVMKDITDDGKLSPVPNNLEDGVVVDGKFYPFNDPNEQILPVGQVSGAAVLPNPKLIKALNRMFKGMEAFMNKLVTRNSRIAKSDEDLFKYLAVKGDEMAWIPLNLKTVAEKKIVPNLKAIEDTQIAEVDAFIDTMTEEEKELLFYNRENMDMLKFNSWFIKNRPNSRFIDSFRKVKGHLKRVDSYSWRTPLDRDPIITRRVKAQYRLMRANSQTLIGNIPYYVVYGLMQKRDLFSGVKLSQPILEVGYSTSPKSMKHIISAHTITLLESLKRTGNVYFRIAYFKSLKKEGVIPQNARFGDYFQAMPIDVAATEEQMRDLEIFYTIYLNRINGRYSYDLEYNQLFNAIVGDLMGKQNTRKVIGSLGVIPLNPQEKKFVIFITKAHLDSAIQTGLHKTDLEWYFREHTRSIDRLLNFYYPGKSWGEIRVEVLTKHLVYLAEQGITHKELTNYLFTSQQDALDIHKNYKNIRVSLRSYTKGEKDQIIIVCLGGLQAYNNILINRFLKTQLREMHIAGFITKEKLIEVIKGTVQLPYLDSGASAHSPEGIAFRWIFELLFAPDITRTLALKDYGGGAVIPMELLKDLGLYTQGGIPQNKKMKSRLVFIINSMYKTTDLSEIYRILNSGKL